MKMPNWKFIFLVLPLLLHICGGNDVREYPAGEVETIRNQYAPGGSYVISRASASSNYAKSVLNERDEEESATGLRGSGRGRGSHTSGGSSDSDSSSQARDSRREHRRLQYERKKDILERLPEPYPAEREPKPFGEHNKVLGLVLMYGFDHVDPFFLMLLPEYVSMCEGGWDPRMIIFTTENWTPLVRRLTMDRAYCYRTGANLDITWAVYNKNISVELGAQHRHYMRDHIDEYDVFLYHEDDIPFKYAAMNAYLAETALLKQRLPWTGLYDNTIGFQRYRHLHRTGNLKDKWSEVDIIEQDLLEEVPTAFETVCMPGEDRAVSPWAEEDAQKNKPAAARRKQRALTAESGEDEGEGEGKGEGRRLSTGDVAAKKVYPYIMVMGNTHQGAYMLTQEHAKILHVKCHFLNHSSPSREYMSSFSLFDRKPWHCGLQKLIPAERMQTFFIQHYYHTKWVSWHPTFTVNDKTRTGKNYIYAANLTNPPCWQPIFDRVKAEMADALRAEAEGRFWRDAHADAPSIYTPATSV